MLTKPLTFSGDRLTLNYSTSSIGHVRIEIQDAQGRAIPGFGLNDCDEIVGDEIARVVTWKGSPDLAKLAGQPVRLRFSLRDADVFALQFPRGSSQ
jgi:hypothetical protein